MSTITKNRRRQRRYGISEGTKARLELTTGGRDREFDVINVSGSGLSFLVNPRDPLPGLEEGAAIDRVTLSVGSCTMKGDLLVMHVTEGRDSRYVCGALFYPATDTDLIKLKSLIAGLEVAGAD